MSRTTCRTSHDNLLNMYAGDFGAGKFKREDYNMQKHCSLDCRRRMNLM